MRESMFTLEASPQTPFYYSGFADLSFYPGFTEKSENIN